MISYLYRLMHRIQMPFSLITANQAKRICILFSAVCIVTSCGWQLRGYEYVDDAYVKTGEDKRISQLKVSSQDRNNSFFRIFKNTLLNQQIELVETALVRIEFDKESLRRQPLTYNSLGVPAQYQLSLGIDFYAASAENIIIEKRTLISRRNYDFDPNLIIAKDREEQELLDEMRRELAERILSELRRAL